MSKRDSELATAAAVEAADLSTSKKRLARWLVGAWLVFTAAHLFHLPEIALALAGLDPELAPHGFLGWAVATLPLLMAVGIVAPEAGTFVSTWVKTFRGTSNADG